MSRLLCGVLAAVLVALAPGAAAARTVRVFAVGPKFGLEWVDTRAHFRDHLVGLVDRTRRGADVQAEADDVASHLRPGDRNLVAFPEDLGLMAIFSGSRGERARGASDVTTSIVDVLGAYAPQTAYYSSRFPALAARGIPTRLLALAATDTFARVAVETYAEIAARYGVWLEGGVNMAQDWKVVCTSKAAMPELPGGVACDEESPAKVAQLQTTDEPERPYAYEATTPDASNMALVFDPNGRLVSKQVKTYLTPIELPGQLDLKPGEVFGGLGAVRTPVGTLGFVTSKDAWMPDVTARLDQEHVDLLVQPEFFVGDTVATTGPWAPDNITGSGYSDLLRHPSIEAFVLPELTGNLFDLSADNQQQIAVKPRSRSPRGALLGQPEAAGWKVVGDWVAPDPASPDETVGERRARLGAIGERLLPREGNAPCPTPAARGICRGGQVEDVIWADVRVARRPALRRAPRRKLGRTPFTRSRPLARADAPQRNVALAARGRRVVAAYEQRVGPDADRVLLVRSRDGGRTWDRPRAVGRGPHRWNPAVALGPSGRLWVAWTDDRTGRQRVYVGRGPGPGAAVDDGVGDRVAQLRPAIAATGRDAAYAAWVDDRARFGGDDLPQAGVFGRALQGEGPADAASRRLDATDPPADLAATLDNAWAPALTARGSRLALTWIDFRDYEWNAYSRTSPDGGGRWDAERAVNTTPDDAEALEDTPRPALIGGDPDPLVAFTDWAKSADSATRASPLYDVATAVPGAPQRKVDGTGAAQVEAFSPAVVAAGRGGAIVAWQDHRRGQADVYAARVTGERAGRPVRVDDSGRRPWNQWRPALARAGRTLVAAWEDERDGPAQIFVARVRAARIR